MFSFIRKQPPLGHDLAICRLPGPLDLTAVERVMVFAPHPDDESLGCGGTLALLARRCEVTVVLVTDGGGAGGLPDGAAKVRQKEFVSALNELSIHHWHCLGAPDGAFESTPGLRQRIDGLLTEHRPQWVFLPSVLDYHRDHLRISDVVTTLCRDHAAIDKLIYYEIWAPVPATHVVDITEVWAHKQRAIAQHKTALACGDYMRAIEGLNSYRGLYLGGTGRRAEAFWIEERCRGETAYKAMREMALRLLRRINGLTTTRV